MQRTVGRVLNLSMNQVEVDTTRLGGGFGGKEDQATTWAVLCALASYHLKKPVKYSLHRMEDMRMTGKRHPYSSDFKIGLSKELKILAYEAKFITKFLFALALLRYFQTRPENFLYQTIWRPCAE